MSKKIVKFGEPAKDYSEESTESTQEEAKETEETEGSDDIITAFDADGKFNRDKCLTLIAKAKEVFSDPVVTKASKELANNVERIRIPEDPIIHSGDDAASRIADALEEMALQGRRNANFFRTVQAIAKELVIVVNKHRKEFPPEFEVILAILDKLEEATHLR